MPKQMTTDQAVGQKSPCGFEGINRDAANILAENWKPTMKTEQQ